ncbi:hypothetical protein BH09ACT11_BH09ACT11_11120 [soil metagenome]
MSNTGVGATPDHREEIPHGSGPIRAPGKPAAPPVTVIDWLMLALALVSVGLLLWITFWEVPDRWVDRVVVTDYVICGVFFVEFCWRWSRSAMGWRFLTHYWYEILGMVPLSDPAFRSFRLIRIVVIVARLARVADRTFGDRAAAYMVSKFADTIVGVIRRPVTVAVLDEVIAVVQTGNYTRHVAAAVDENRAELDAMILELVRADPVAGKMRYAPFHDDIVKLVTDTVLRIMDGALTDPRVHELISDAIRESATELRTNVRTRMTDHVKQDAEKFGR